MNTTRKSPRVCTPALLVLAAAAAPAFAQIYQKVDTIPLNPNNVANPPTNLQAVVATADGGYLAVGRESTFNIHLARYDSAGNVLWSRYSTTNFDIGATSINQLTAPNPVYVVAGEVADALPFGTWSMVIDGAGNITCPVREIDGVGPAAPASRSPVAAKPLNDGGYVLTGRAQPAATAQIYGRLTRFTPNCGPVMWSMLYTPTGGIPGLTGACEITDVVQETGSAGTLLAIGTANLANGGSVPFLLRVSQATGAVVFSQFYGVGDPAQNVRGDGLAYSFDAAGALDGYIFDGRSTPVVAGVPIATSNYVVKVGPTGLNVLWAETFQNFAPAHAAVRYFANATVLAGTHNTPNGAVGVWGALISSTTGSPIWNWDYGHGFERGNGVDITVGTPVSPAGPIIVGTGGAAAVNGGFLVKSAITSGSTGTHCQTPMPQPAPAGAQRPSQFAAMPVQDFRIVELPLIPETLHTLDACPPFPVCCNPDFNNDGDIGTDADIEDFFACLGGSCCPTCGSADFNCDGDIGTDSDIEAFFRVLAGGPC